MSRIAGLQGIVTPLITPIDRDESLDCASLTRLVQYQLQAGVGGLWVMGTSAEFAGFSTIERMAALDCVLATTKGQVPVICNVSAAATREAIVLGRGAAKSGADAIAVTPPYYYPHSQDEVLAHCRALRDAVDLPLFIYNIPQTVRVRVELSTAYALITDGTVSGVKDSQNDLEWFRQVTTFASRNRPDFVAFAGTRYLIDAAVLAGAAGAIPNIANIFPELCIATFQSAASGDFAASAGMSQHIMELENAAAFDGGSRNARSLGAIKALLVRKGVIDSAALTTPLRSPSEVEMQDLYRRVDQLLGDVSLPPK
ncbi:MAG TPA: dihydrodipicolinate synthase family protein [Chloroflexota bacterium]